MQNTTTKKSKNIMDMFSGKQILIPIAALLLLAVFNLIADPSFYKISMDVNSAGNHVLSGYLITILDYGSELAILAIGMTLVTAASGGQDISVGAGIAVAGSVILRVLCGTNSRPDKLQAPIIVAFLVACVAVSDTHLGVYKRQMRYYASGNGGAGAFKQIKSVTEEP